MTTDPRTARPGARTPSADLGARTPSARLTSLRGRLMVAFAAVAIAAIALVTAAAVVGTDRGLSAQAAADRQQLADRAAAAAAQAYARRGGWDDADLGQAVAIASGAGARVIIRALDGEVVATTGGHGMGGGQGTGGQGTGGQDMRDQDMRDQDMRDQDRDAPGMGMGGQGMGGQGMGVGPDAQLVLAPVQSHGSTVGSVALVYTGSARTAGRPVAWTWVGAAAVTALALAIGAAWLITRMLTRPLAVLTATARSFAAGDRQARTRLHTPDELGELAAAFDDAAEQVSLSERARRQLSADVAHELRTPLAALQAGLEELRDGLAPADAATLARLHDQTLRLGRVVTDLAELSAADAARLTLRTEPVDLAAVAGDAADVHEPPLRAAGLTLERRLDAAPVDGDAHRLHQVVGNLLQNCARHCRPGDAVTLVVAPDPATGTARLTVTDTGPGIPPEDLPHVFTRFWRGGEGGSGLGMAIVHALVEAHGGSVRVESDGRSGTCVTVELPLQPA